MINEIVAFNHEGTGHLMGPKEKTLCGRLVKRRLRPIARAVLCGVCQTVLEAEASSVAARKRRTAHVDHVASLRPGEVVV